MSASPASPEAYSGLDASAADRLLDRLEKEVPQRPPLAEIASPGAGSAIVFGDSHGDWRSTAEVVARFEAAGPGAVLVGLGDYVDRSPAELPHGSVVNALLLLDAASRWPDRVYLLQGNHETARRLGVRPRDLPREVAALWGEDATRLRRLVSLLERGPLAAYTGSGAYFAHAGFPRGPLPAPWTAAFERVDDDRLSEIVWAECAASSIRRGVVDPFTEPELASFLAASGLSVFLRGHDPDLAGQRVFGDRCLTLHTTRVFERYGGILVADVPLSGRIADLGGVRVDRLSVDRPPTAPR
ncbi:MAG TPA: metallophosphoesterase [Thermoplasmata archaeon]|nr:metallophosphoesterase [Thermoplasmata archaeon]